MFLPGCLQDLAPALAEVAPEEVQELRAEERAAGPLLARLGFAVLGVVRWVGLGWGGVGWAGGGVGWAGEWGGLGSGVGWAGVWAGGVVGWGCRVGWGDEVSKGQSQP